MQLNEILHMYTSVCNHHPEQHTTFQTPEGSILPLPLGVLYLHAPKCCCRMFVVSDVLVNVKQPVLVCVGVPCFIAFVSFCGVNIPAVADFKP